MKQVQVDDDIPLSLYDIATRHRVGLPLKRLHKKKPRNDYLSIGLFLLIIVAPLGYNIYAYNAFISLSHTYPDISKVPAAQLNNYFWLKALHDLFWANLRTFTIPLLTTLIISQAIIHYYGVCRATKDLYLYCWSARHLVEKRGGHSLGGGAGAIYYCNGEHLDCQR